MGRYIYDGAAIAALPNCFLFNTHLSQHVFSSSFSGCPSIDVYESHRVMLARSTWYHWVPTQLSVCSCSVHSQLTWWCSLTSEELTDGHLGELSHTMSPTRAWCRFGMLTLPQVSPLGSASHSAFQFGCFYMLLAWASFKEKPQLCPEWQGAEISSFMIGRGLMERFALPICHPSTQCLKVPARAATSPATHKEWFLDKVNTNAQEPQICVAEHVAKNFRWAHCSVDAVSQGCMEEFGWSSALLPHSYISAYTQGKEKLCPAHDRADYASEHLHGCCLSETVLNEVNISWCCISKLKKLCQQGGRWREKWSEHQLG